MIKETDFFTESIVETGCEVMGKKIFIDETHVRLPTEVFELFKTIMEPHLKRIEK